MQRKELGKESIFLYFKMKNIYENSERGYVSKLSSPSAYREKERNRNINVPCPKFCKTNLVLEDKKVGKFFGRRNMNFGVFRIDSSHVTVLGSSYKVLLVTIRQGLA